MNKRTINLLFERLRAAREDSRIDGRAAARGIRAAQRAFELSRKATTTGDLVLRPALLRQAQRAQRRADLLATPAASRATE